MRADWEAGPRRLGPAVHAAVRRHTRQTAGDAGGPQPGLSLSGVVRGLCANSAPQRRTAPRSEGRVCGDTHALPRQVTQTHKTGGAQSPSDRAVQTSKGCKRAYLAPAQQPTLAAEGWTRGGENERGRRRVELRGWRASRPGLRRTHAAGARWWTRCTPHGPAGSRRSSGWPWQRPPPAQRGVAKQGGGLSAGHGVQGQARGYAALAACRHHAALAAS